MNPQLLSDYVLAAQLSRIKAKLAPDEQAILDEACRRFSRPENAGHGAARVVHIDAGRIPTLVADTESRVTYAR